MKATHFGAGNIGRGFIGEVLADNNFTIEFVDINEKVINALIDRGEYHIGLAHEGRDTIHITDVTGINNAKNPQAAIDSVATSDLVTTAIGPNVIPFIVELIAKGIQKRRENGNETPIDIIACENMIGGSEFLYSKMETFLNEEDKHISNNMSVFQMQRSIALYRFNPMKIRYLFLLNLLKSGLLRIKIARRLKLNWIMSYMLRI